MSHNKELENDLPNCSVDSLECKRRDREKEPTVIAGIKMLEVLYNRIQQRNQQ